MRVPTAVLALAIAAFGPTSPSIAEDAPVDVTIGVSSNSFGARRRAHRGAGRLVPAQQHRPEDRSCHGQRQCGDHRAGRRLGAVRRLRLATITARARKQPIVIVTNFYRSLSASVIIAKSVADKSVNEADSPITDRLRVLNGLAVAEPSATSAYVAPRRGADHVQPASLKLVYAATRWSRHRHRSQAMVAGAPFWGPAMPRPGVLDQRTEGRELPADCAEQLFVPTNLGLVFMSPTRRRSAASRR